MPLTPDQCEICRTLPASASQRFLTGYVLGRDRQAEPASPGLGHPEAARLLRLQASPFFAEVERCPLCGTYYRFHGETRFTDDLEEERIEARWRIGPLEALTLLDGLDGAAAAAERARIEAGLGEQVAGLETSLRSTEARERRAAAGDLVRHHQRRRAWKKVERLLRHQDPLVRAGAVEVLGLYVHDGAPRPTKSVVRTLEALLDDHWSERAPGEGEDGDDEIGSLALRALEHLEGHPALAPAIPSLIDRLDADDPRGKDWDLLLATHFRLILQNPRLRSGRPTAGSGAVDRRVPEPTPDLLERIPALVRHLVAPRTRQPTRRLPVHRHTTDSTAAWVLSALALKNETAARAIRHALDTCAGAAEALCHLSGEPGLREKLGL